MCAGAARRNRVSEPNLASLALRKLRKSMPRIAQLAQVAQWQTQSLRNAVSRGAQSKTTVLLPQASDAIGVLIGVQNIGAVPVQHLRQSRHDAAPIWA